jgi:hypothetical protein
MMFVDNGHVKSLGLFKHLDIASALQCLGSGRIGYDQTSIHFNPTGATFWFSKTIKSDIKA